MNLAILNYSGCTANFYQIDKNLTSEQVEEWISENTEHRLTDIHWMYSGLSKIEILNN